MKKLIVEVWKKSNLKQVSDSTIPDGMMMIEGVLGRVDSMNRNNRIYPRAEYEKHVGLLQKRINESNGVLGEMEHPKSMNINLNNVSHKIVEARVDEDGFVRGKVLLLDTPKGKIAQSIVKSGTPLPISSRALGNVSESNEVTLEFLSTYDLVGTSGFMEATMGTVTESLDEEGNVISETYEYDVDDNNDVVAQSTLQGIVEAVEARLEKKFASRMNENATGLKESDLDKLIENKIADLAPAMQEFILSEQQTPSFDVNAIKTIMNEQFINVYAKSIQGWVLEEFTPKLGDQIQEWFINDAAPIVENWITSDLLPENAQLTENWIKSTLLPNVSESIQSWIVEEYGPKHSETLQEWLEGDFKDALLVEAKNEEEEEEIQDTDDSVEKINKEAEKDEEETDESKNSKKSVKESVTLKSQILSSIDVLLEKANNIEDVEKDEEEEEDKKKSSKVDESLYKNGAPVWLQHIPQDFKYIWESLTQDQRANVYRRASIRVFENIGQISKFWNSLNVNEMLTENKETYKRSISLNEDQKQQPSAFVNFAKSLNNF